MIAYRELELIDRWEESMQTSRLQPEEFVHQSNTGFERVLETNKQDEQHIYGSLVSLKGYDVKPWLQDRRDQVMQECHVRRDAHPMKSHDVATAGLPR